jgi:hypothetical protein
MSPQDASFAKQTIEVIAKRAGNRCSNPDCDALTVGPAEIENRTIVIGEAAHIFGARPGSARFNATMSDAERRDITNAIWLCRNCHKMVDDDPGKFTADILFEWHQHHERVITAALGKPSELLREKVRLRELEPFQSCSHLAQQILIDRPPYWEWKLTAELLRTKLSPITKRWRDLKLRMYAVPPVVVPLAEMGNWQRARMQEISMQVDAITEIVNSRLQEAWGPPGVPTNPEEVLQACDLFAASCKGFLVWEETVRFAILPRSFDDFQKSLQGIGGKILEDVAQVPKMLSAVFENGEPAKENEILIRLALPDGWGDRVAQAFVAGCETAG